MVCGRQACTLATIALVSLMHLLQTFLVEDSPVIRENLIATLEELAPVRVVGFAADESAARGWLTERPAELVIIDLFLLGGSGLGVLRSGCAKQNGSHQVVLSNYATAEMRQRCLLLGADAVFDKSTEIEALVAYCCRLALEHQPVDPAA